MKSYLEVSMFGLRAIISQKIRAPLASKALCYLLLAVVTCYIAYKTINNLYLFTNDSNRGKGSHPIYTQYGYDYVRQIFEKLPDKKIVPTVRYKDYWRDVYLLFPEKYASLTSDIMIAIDVTAKDFVQQPIARLSAHQSDWQFSTIYDYDSLDGFSFSINRCDQDQMSVQVKVFSTLQNKTELKLEEFDFTCTLGVQSLIFNTPLKQFSFGRGATPYRVAFSPSLNQTNVDTITALGTKIDIGDYSEINRYKNNYVFIKKSLGAPSSLISKYSDFIRQLNQLSHD
jgi:hypothetical protein